MNITLSDRHAELARKHAAEAGFDDVGEYFQYILETDEAQDEETHEEFLHSLREGLADIAAGEKGRPFDEVMAELATKHGLTLPK